MSIKIKELYESGLSCRSIASQLKISRKKVSASLSDLGVSLRVKSCQKETSEMLKLYSDGYSYEQIAEAYQLTRQAVWSRLKVAGVKSREKKLLPFVMYNGEKFTLGNHGYYRNTCRKNGERLLHRYKYECENGALPCDWDVHHIDLCKTNNELSNLHALSKADHTRLHQELKRCK